MSKITAAASKSLISEKKFKIFAAIVLLLLFTVGLFVSSDYSMGWDEPHEVRILMKNIRTITETFMGSDTQIVYLFKNMGINSIVTDIERDHGQAAYYPFALLFFQPQFLSGSFDYSMVSNPYGYYTYIVCFTAIIAFYLLVTELLGDRKLALLCAAILFIMPRFFAESHYNNKDMVLFCLLMDTCCFGVRAIKRRHLADALLFALFAALTANTKIIGIFFFGVIGSFYVIYLTIKRQWDRRGVLIMIATILAFCLIYYAVTPALWENPVGYFQYCFDNALHFSRWGGTVLFNGTLYNPANGELPRRYIPQLMLLTTPIYVSILAAVGLYRIAMVLIQKKTDNSEVIEKIFFVTMICCCAFIPLLVSIINRSLVYNGWRHFYFSFAGVAILMAYGMDLLHRRWAKVATCVILICIIFTSTQNIINHPHQYVYYNFLAGDDILHNYELDYWALSAAEGVAYIANSEQGNVTLACLDNSTRVPIVYGVDLLPAEDKIRIKVLEEGDICADYLIQNTTYACIYKVPSIPENYYLEKTIFAYGEPILNIYAWQ